MNVPCPLPSRWRAGLCAAILVYALIVLGTQPDNYRDTLHYARHIADHQAKVVSSGEDPFWDFGHALWRPMGYLLWPLFRGHGQDVLAAASALIAWSLLGGLLCTVFLYLLAARSTGKTWIAFLVTAGFLGTQTLVNYAPTGTAYLAGAACQIAALYLLDGAIRGDRFTWKRASGAGALLGASFCIWFPFSLSLPGLLCYGLFWPHDGAKNPWREASRRVPFLLQTAAWTAVVAIAVYAVVMLLGHVTTLAAAKAWFARSRYRILPTLGYLRLLAGVPRSFFWLGDDGVVWKRLLLRSPDHPVSLAELAGTGLWKVAFTYTVLGLLVYRLTQSGKGRTLLVCLVVVALPIALFASFLFDPSAPERYLPAYPLLFLGFAHAMAEPRAAWFGRAVVPAFFSPCSP